MYCYCQIFIIFAFAEQFQQGTSPDDFGHFLCPQYKGGGALRGSQKPSLVGRFSSVNATALFVGLNLNNFVMLNIPTSSDAAQSTAKSAETIINDLKFYDIPTMRQHLTRMAMEYLLNSEGDIRNEVYATYLNLDAVLMDAEQLAGNR